MTNLILYILISFTNVFLHITRSILVIKGGKFLASTANCVKYTFSAIVVKFISESDLITAMIVAATTNFVGCYVAMLVCEKFQNYKKYLTEMF